MPKIMLDAGHSRKYNRSPAVPEYWESDMSWKLHLLLKSELEKYGITVGVTRSNKDTDMEVYTRGTMARGYDMFVSLHSNAVGSGVNETVDYPVVYRLSSDLSGFAVKTAAKIAETMNTNQSGRDGTRLQDSGIEYYGVLRGAAAVGCPRAYIFEHSFHTATKPSRWLLNENNLAVLAKNEAKLIAEYYNIKTEEEEMTNAEKVEFDALKKRVADLEKKYHLWTELPSWASKPIRALYDAHLFSGRSPADLDLTDDMMRMLVVLASALKNQGKLIY